MEVISCTCMLNTHLVFGSEKQHCARGYKHTSVRFRNITYLIFIYLLISHINNLHNYFMHKIFY